MSGEILIEKLRDEFEHEISRWNNDRISQAYDILRQRYRENEMVMSITKMRIETIEKEMKRRDGGTE